MIRNENNSNWDVLMSLRFLGKGLHLRRWSLLLTAALAALFFSFSAFLASLASRASSPFSTRSCSFWAPVRPTAGDKQIGGMATERRVK